MPVKPAMPCEDSVQDRDQGNEHKDQRPNLDSYLHSFGGTRAVASITLRSRAVDCLGSVPWSPAGPSRAQNTFDSMMQAGAVMTTAVTRFSAFAPPICT